jgi:WD40 repeat protein
VFRVKDGALLLRLAPASGATAVAFSPDGTRFAAIVDSHLTLNEWRLPDGVLIAHRRELNPVVPTYYFEAITFRPNGNDLLVTDSTRLESWGALDPTAPLPQELGVLARSKLYAQEQLQFSANGSTLALTYGSEVLLLDGASPSLMTDMPRRTIASEVDGRVLMAFSPDGRALIAGASPPGVLALDVASQTLSYRVEGVTAAAYSPDGTILATTSWPALGASTGVDLRRASDGTLQRTLAQNVYAVSSLAFSPDGREIAVGTTAGPIERLSVPSGQSIATLTPQWTAQWPAEWLRYSPDGAQLVGVSNGRGGEVRRVSDGSLLYSVPGSPPFLSVSYFADGSRAATIAFDAQSSPIGAVMRTSDWSVLSPLPNRGYRHGFAVDPLTGWVAMSSVLATDLVRLDGTLVQSFPAVSNPGSNWSLAFSADGRRLAVSDPSSIVRVYCR